MPDETKPHIHINKNGTLSINLSPDVEFTSKQVENFSQALSQIAQAMRLLELAGFDLYETYKEFSNAR